MYNNLEAFCDVYGITLYGMSIISERVHICRVALIMLVSAVLKSGIDLSLTLNNLDN